jgi:excinuclease UvrABC nuclease subunit
MNKCEGINLRTNDPKALPPNDRKKLAKELRRRMTKATKDMEFELAAEIRDKIADLKNV